MYAGNPLPPNPTKPNVTFNVFNPNRSSNKPNNTPAA